MAVTKEIAQKQMNQSPWEVRAEILRATALRLEQRAVALKDEASALRCIANECDAEALRISLKQSI